jgi:DNA-cytosine methyltransferase
MKEGINVLSLFDGMSCGQIALDKLGVKVNKYFACEIDKYAMQVTQHNFPDTIQLGDVQFVTKETFGNHKIDLVIGGSPCQGFSFAGKMLNFDDPRSKLFFEYVRLVNELKPKYFLLENVKMKQESKDIITKYMGVDPIEINSALVSAQTRKRLYWTNIPNVGQPEDKGIVLKDIIESGMAGEAPVKHTDRNRRHLKDVNDKSLCTSATMYKEAGNNGMTLIQVDDKVKLNENQQKKIEKINNVNPDKANCLTEAIGRGGSSSEYLTSVKKKTDAIKQVGDKLRHPEATKKGYAEAGEGEGLDLTFPDSKTRRGRAMKDKSNCLTAASHEMGVVEEDKELRPATIVGRRLNERGVRDDYNKDVPITQCLQVKHNSDKTGTLTTVEKDNVLSENEPGRYPNAYEDKKLVWRKLTPLECERLQTVDDGYTLVLDENGKQLVSDSQRYKMLGNGWTIDVITHIMKNMEL